MINSSLLHKILPQPNGSFQGKSPARDEAGLDKIDKSKFFLPANFDLNDKDQIQLLRAVSGGDEEYAKKQKQKIVLAYSTSKNTVQVQS